MFVVPIVVAAVLGVMLAESGREWLGLGLGGTVGWLFAKVRSLELQLRNLHRAEIPTTQPRTSRPAASAIEDGEPESPPIRTEPVKADETPARQAAAIESPAVGLFKPESETVQTTAPTTVTNSPIDKLLAVSRNWLTTGNVPVKVGIIILFFGIAFLFKYAVDNRLLVLPTEFRLLGVAVLAAVVFGFGWKLRDKSRVYALNLQGAGIGILYLTIYAAFRLYGVLPAVPAFALMVLLTLSSGALALKQESRGLAAFACIGGFLAPLLTSTGQGSHVALFSYYLLINISILGLSWFRAWRSLNLIGFLFTFVVGTYWGFKYYTPELYGSVQPFLILNFLFYQAIAILYAFRQPPRLRSLVDGTIIFGTPAVVFSLQTQLVSDTEWGLAISASVMSAFYALVAAWLHRTHGERMRLLAQSMVVLAVGLATIAVPLALDDRWSAIAWALEGAGVVWLGVRQNSMLSRLTGSALIIGSGYFYFEHGWHYDEGTLILNGNVLGGLIIGCASIFAARQLATDAQKMSFQTAISVALLLWGTTWWLATGAMEINDRVRSSIQLEWLVTFVTASFALLSAFAHRLDWSAASRLTFTYLPVLVPLSFIFLWDNEHLFEDWGWLIWPFAFAAHFLILRLSEPGSSRLRFLWHIGGTLVIVGFIGQEAFWRVFEAGFSDVWRTSAALLVPVLACAAILRLRSVLSWPLQQHWPAYVTAATVVIIGQLTLLFIAAMNDSGNPAPLPYIPLLNPFDWMTILGLGTGYWVLQAYCSVIDNKMSRQVLIAHVVLGLFAFTLTTLMIVRGVHHIGDVPWSNFTLRRSVSVQSALSIYWAMLGFGGMILGTRKTQYWIWVTGVALMVIVVLKLFFVDLGNTGTVARIVSFLGVGALLMIVGYFAPRPPRPGTSTVNGD